jgi:hypothetical protein
VASPNKTISLSVHVNTVTAPSVAIAFVTGTAGVGGVLLDASATTDDVTPASQLVFS